MTTSDIFKKLVALKYHYEKIQPSRKHVEIIFFFKVSRGRLSRSSKPKLVLYKMCF